MVAVDRRDARLLPLQALALSACLEVPGRRSTGSARPDCSVSPYDYKDAEIAPHRARRPAGVRELEPAELAAPGRRDPPARRPGAGGRRRSEAGPERRADRERRPRDRRLTAARPVPVESARGAAVGALAARVHQVGRRRARLRLLPRRRGRRRGGARRPPRRARVRAAEQVPVLVGAPDGRAVPARRRVRRARRRRGARDPPARRAGDRRARARPTRRTASTSAGTSAGSPAPASSTTSTCTSSRAGAATRTSCRCSRT